MKKMGFSLIVIQILLITTLLTGCWNYRDLDQLSIVAGVAIDKGSKDKYLVTIEVVDIKSEGKNVKTASKKIQAEGATIFDSVRNAIKITGRRLYWSHVKICIISNELAREGLVEIIDFFARDAESRLTLNFLISKEKTASELLSQQSVTSEIRSYEIKDMLKAQKSVSKSPDVKANELINVLSGDGISAALPSIGIIENEGMPADELSGTAVFKKDKLVGFLDEKETKDYLFVINRVNGGLITDINPPESKGANITLEIFNSRTKVRPDYSNGKLSINMYVESDVAIDELGTTKNYIENKEMKKLVSDVENKLEEDIKKTVERVQDEYDADIFGFGLKVKKDMPEVWKKIGNGWDDEFRNLDIHVNVKLNVRNTGLMLKPIKVGD